MVTKEQVKKCLDKFANDYLSTREEIECFDYAIKVVDEHKTGWIPVTERLPNSNGCYLVWRPHFFGGEIGMPSICYFDGQNTWHDSYGVDFERVLSSDDVAAWMPLPEPYEEGAEE